MAVATRPVLDLRINRFPAPKIEVADAEVGALRDIQRLAQSRKKFEFNVVNFARQIFVDGVGQLNSLVFHK